jgi:hypothetical protein
MNRIYGKPEAALVDRVPPNPAVEMIRSLSFEEKLSSCGVCETASWTRQRLRSPWSNQFRRPRSPTTPRGADPFRSPRFAARRMSALDWAAKVVEENGRELAESFLTAARNGDWRAAEALMNRIYGRPEAAVVAHVAPNPMADVIRSLSLAEKLELLHRLRQGEAVALPVVEGSAHSPSTTAGELGP